MFSWDNRLSWCYVWKWGLLCLVYEESSEQVVDLINFSLRKIVEFFVHRIKKYETTCVLHESFSSILKKYVMIVRPYLQCKSPFFTVYDISTFVGTILLFYLEKIRHDCKTISSMQITFFHGLWYLYLCWDISVVSGHSWIVWKNL